MVLGERRNDERDGGPAGLRAVVLKHRGAGFAMNRRRTPIILQMTSVDCGAACLAMVLNHFGRKTRLAECRSHCDPGRNGVSVLTIVTAARKFGLRTKALSLRLPDLSQMPVPCIVHWTGNHFVLPESWSPTQVQIVDPARGRR